MNKFYSLVYRILWVLAGILFPWRTTGRERLPAEGGAVLCANHTSFLDPILVMLAATNRRQMRVVAKAELFRIPVLNWILKGLGIIPVKRGMSDVGSFKECLKALRSGELLLIFPEGTRVKDGESVEARAGAVLMAARAGVPVMPVYIGKKKRLFRRTDVVFGQAYELEFEGRKPTHEESQRMTEDLMGRIRALGENTHEG